VVGRRFELWKRPRVAGFGLRLIWGAADPHNHASREARPTTALCQELRPIPISCFKRSLCRVERPRRCPAILGTALQCRKHQATAGSKAPRYGAELEPAGYDADAGGYRDYLDLLASAIFAFLIFEASRDFDRRL